MGESHIRPVRVCVGRPLSDGGKRPRREEEEGELGTVYGVMGLLVTDGLLVSGKCVHVRRSSCLLGGLGCYFLT